MTNNKKNKKNEEFKMYHDNGQLYESSQYVNDLRHGEENYYPGLKDAIMKPIVFAIIQLK
jgi:antitoxin component YwqK of YwqJK toxin-antitoxin module